MYPYVFSMSVSHAILRTDLAGIFTKLAKGRITLAVSILAHSVVLQSPSELEQLSLKPTIAY